MTKQYGIIYKFTIVAKLKMDGQRPFYVGQHITTLNPEEFLSRDYYYYGSGSIWGDFIEKLRELNPNNWRCFIKREILFASDKVTQRGLDAMEAYYIKREKSHYSYKQGGCNVLWSATEIPTKNPIIAKKLGDILRGRKLPIEVVEKVRKALTGRKLSFEVRNKIRKAALGKKHSNETKLKLRNIKLGSHASLETKEKLSKSLKGKNLGKIRSEETKQKLSESHIGLQAGQNHPMYGKHHSEETRRMLSEKLRGRKLSEKELERRTGYRWINNGETSIQFKGDILPQGYKYGRIKWKK